MRWTIRNCPVLREKKIKYSSDECDDCPRKRLRGLDKRYRTEYGMSMIENLENINESGIGDLVRNEKTRWSLEQVRARDLCPQGSVSGMRGKKRHHEVTNAGLLDSPLI